MRGSGWIVNEEAGENLGNHKLVYRNASGTWSLADADAAATMPVLGITMGAIPIGRKGEILLWGYIGDEAWAWTAGDEIYASATAGELTQTIPAGAGDIVQTVAVAVTTLLIQFQGNLGSQFDGSNTLEGETAFVGFDASKSHYVNYFLCDGTADDVQIQLATNYVSSLGGGIVLIETGNYNIADTITVPTFTRYHITGNLTLANNADVDMFDLDAAAQYVEFYGGLLYGNKNNQGATVHGINISDSKYVWIHDMRITHFTGSAIYTNVASNVLMMNDCWITHHDGAGIDLASLGDSNIIGNSFGLNGTTGITMGGGGSSFIGNTCFTNGTDGIWVGGNGNVIIANELNNNDNAGIQVTGTETMISNNEIHDNGQNGGPVRRESGIYCNGAEDTIISNNMIFDEETTQQYGIYLYDSINTIIEGNLIKNHTVDGIEIDNDSDDNQIINNIITGNAVYGVNVVNANCDNNSVKDNIFSGNVSAALNDVGTNTEIHEFFAPLKDPDTNIGDHPGVVLTDGETVDVYDQIMVQLGFQELVTASVIVIPGGTGNMRWQCDTDFGKICAGETYNTHSDSIVANNTAVTINELECITISNALTDISDGDLVGVKFTRLGGHVDDTVNANCYYMGIRMRYV